MNTISTKIALQLDSGEVKLFDTRAEATAYVQRPQQRVALGAFVESTELVEWLLDNRDEIEGTFDSAKIRRVTKSERNQLAKALEAIAKADDKSFNFVVENRESVLNSFRWPAVKRVSEEEQTEIVRANMLQVCGGDTPESLELTNFLIANKEALLAGYEAGAIKREVSPKAIAGLAAYRERVANEKAAKEAAEAGKNPPAAEGEAAPATTAAA